MILQALYDHYQTLLQDEDSGIAKPGYSVAKVSHVLVISQAGKLMSINSIMKPEGKRFVPSSLLVPLQKKRSNGVNPYFLCDKCDYFLGISFDNNKIPFVNETYFSGFCERQEKELGELECNAARIYLSFLKDWDPTEALHHWEWGQVEDLANSSMLAIRIDGFKGYLHENAEIVRSWEAGYRSISSDYQAQCLVTGENAPICRLHPNIKNVPGAQTSGAAIVSFNMDALISYQGSKRCKDVQSYNAPVSEAAAEAYGTVLNYLLTTGKNIVDLADTRVVFWAERSAKDEESIIRLLLNPPNENIVDSETDITGDDKKDRPKQKYSEAIVDHVTSTQVRSILSCVQQGRSIQESSVVVDENVKFYMLGLAPNMSRLSIRFWHVASFGDLVRKIGQHYQDMSIVGNSDRIAYLSVRSLLRETAALRDSKRIPPLLGGSVMKAILTGQAYPQTLYATIISRIRAEQDSEKVKKVNETRAAIIKACGIRRARIAKNHEKEALYTVGLNEENKNTGYQLGRLFALLEKAQQDAVPGTNATIRDRYFGAASATPGKVFPILLRLSQHHISKADRGVWTDRLIQSVMDCLDGFPSHLVLEDQGLFVLGYYHQKQSHYTKKSTDQNTDLKEE